jgi:hypothetical protein
MIAFSKNGFYILFDDGLLFYLFPQFGAVSEATNDGIIDTSPQARENVFHMFPLISVFARFSFLMERGMKYNLFGLFRG